MWSINWYKSFSNIIKQNFNLMIIKMVWIWDEQWHLKLCQNSNISNFLFVSKWVELVKRFEMKSNVPMKEIVSPIPQLVCMSRYQGALSKFWQKEFRANQKLSIFNRLILLMRQKCKSHHVKIVKCVCSFYNWTNCKLTYIDLFSLCKSIIHYLIKSSMMKPRL